MYSSQITITLIGREKRSGEDPREIDYEIIQMEGEKHMAKKVGDVGLELGATIPGVFGDYSSFHVQISVVEKNANLDAGYEKVLDKLNSRMTPHLARLMDGALKKLGKRPIMTSQLNLKKKGN